MKLKNYIMVVFAIIISLLCVYFTNKEQKLDSPVPCYRVYLKGKTIGLISSRDELDEYINKQQEKLKEKYNVDKVYIPNDIDVVKDVTYDQRLNTIEEVYKKINDISPFTIKGYKVKIDRKNNVNYRGDEHELTEEELNGTNILYINIVNKDILEESIMKVVLSFVTTEQYKAFTEGTQAQIESTGEVIEDIFIDNNITIQEANIPVNEPIYTTTEELTKYLIFGGNESDKTYIVKSGDEVADVAEKNKMSVNELLIANDEIKSETALLYAGQVLSIGILDPVFSTVVEKHVVADQTVKYKTTYKYDNTMYQGQTKILQQGQNGINRVTEKIKIVNGEVQQAYIVSNEEIRPVVNKIVARGGKQSPRGDGEWSWPTNFPWRVSSGIGWRWGSIHRGIDIIGPGAGSPIYAARDGVVVESKYDGSRGYHVIIQHYNGYYTQYMHMQTTPYVKKGQTVYNHQVIGAMGCTGSCTGTHLHFELWDGPPYASGAHYFDARNFY